MYDNRTYAKILFDLCSKANCISSIQKELNSIIYLFNKIPSFRLVLITKRLNAIQKKEIIAKTLTMFNKLVVEFISIIISNNETHNLLDIIYKFNHLVISSTDIMKIDIVTAKGLNQADIDSLSQSLSDILKTNPKINLITEPTMIGGVKLRIGNRIFDNSVSYQINQLKKSLRNM